MKIFKSLTALAVMTSMMFATSCNDEVNDYVQHTNVQVSNDRLCGYTNLIVPANDIASERISLAGTNVRVTNENSMLNYTIEVDAEGAYLLPHLNGSNKERYFDNVTITSADGSKEETLQVCIDPAETMTRAGIMTPTLSDQQNKAAEYLGCTVDYFSSPGDVVKSGIIGLNRFLQNEDYRTSLTDALKITQKNSYDHFYSKETSLTRLSESVDKQTGINAKFPVYGYNITSGFTSKHFKSNTKETSREYLLAGVNLTGFEAQLDIDELAALSEDLGLQNKNTSSTANPYACILSRSFNNALNNPSSVAGSAYKNTKESMVDFLDTYGTHVVTEAQFGAYAQLSYSMDKTSETTKIEDFVSFELGISSATTSSSETKKETTATEGDDKNKTIAKTILSEAVKQVTPSLEFKNSNKKTNDELRQSCHTQYKIVVGGGIQVGAEMDLSSWKPGAVSDMVVLKYGNSNTVKQVAAGGDNKTLVPVYKFCTDPERKQILEELLTPAWDNEEHAFVIPYYKEKAKKNLLKDMNPNNQPVVVADVQLVYISTKNLTDALVKPLQLEDHYGVTRTYYPMVMNSEFPNKNDVDVISDQGYALTLNHTAFIGADFEKDTYGRLLCYYALDYADRCKGITSVRLLTPDEYQYDHRPRNEYTAMQKVLTASDGKTKIVTGATTWNGVCMAIKAGGDRRLYVTYADNDAKISDKITGVAWHIGDPTKPWEGQVIGASGGTECGIDNTFSTSDQAEFAEYWHTKGNVMCDNGNTYLSAFVRTEQKIVKPSLLDLFAKGLGYGIMAEEKKTTYTDIVPQYNIHPVFTKKPIKRDMSLVLKGKTNTADQVGSFPVAYPNTYTQYVKAVKTAKNS